MSIPMTSFEGPAAKPPGREGQGAAIYTEFRRLIRVVMNLLLGFLIASFLQESSQLRLGIFIPGHLPANVPPREAAIPKVSSASGS